MTAERLSKTSNSGAWDVLAFVQALAAEATAGRIEIPSFPDVALQIRRVLSDDDCDTGTVARIASAEPALAARLLQMANSVALNPGRSKVTELRSAISRIGFSQVRTA